MRSAPRDQNTADGPLTTTARLAGTLIYGVLKLEQAPFAVGIDIIRDRRAAEPDGFFEHLTQRQSETLELVKRDPVTPAARPDAGLMQTLVRIDVAHPSQQRLIEQSRFDCHVPAMEECGEFTRANGKRIGAWALECGIVFKIAEFEAAKTARIHEAQLAAAFEVEPRVRVGSNGAIGICDQQPARHAQVYDPLCFWLVSIASAPGKPLCAGRVHIAARTKLKDDMFPGSVHGQYRASDETVSLPDRRCLEGLRLAAKPSLDDTVAIYALVNAAGDRLHLWEFRHRFIVEDRQPAAGASSRAR
jgi:hypothetical protein